MEKAKHLIFSSFILKVAALLFMTLDDVGLLVRTMYYYKFEAVEASNVLRGFGRLALPLFVFMIVEGVIHTKNIKKYFLRLGIMALFISIVLAIVTYVDFGFDTSAISGAGNIFLDLLLLAVTIYLLKQEKIYLKFLAVIPLAISIISFAVKGYEVANFASINWYPPWLYLQYDWFSLLLGILFYFSYKIGDFYISIAKDENGINEEYWEIEGHKRFLVNTIQVFMLVIVSVLYYAFKYIWPKGVFWDVETQLFAIGSGAFILLYNGKRGYNAKWFQYGSYLYYPLHLGIIILIFIIINGGL